MGCCRSRCSCRRRSRVTCSLPRRYACLPSRFPKLAPGAPRSRLRRAHACAALATARRQLTQRTGFSAHRAPASQRPYHLMLLPPLPACLSLQVPRVVPPRHNSLPASLYLSPPHLVCCRAACKLQHCSRAPHVRRRVGNNRDVARVQRRPGHGAPPAAAVPPPAFLGPNPCPASNSCALLRAAAVAAASAPSRAIQRAAGRPPTTSSPRPPPSAANKS